jgi:F-type H+-transporting ATPase subunit delta
MAAASASSDRLDAYAGALFGVARAEGSLERVEAELYEVARAIERNDELRSKITDQSLPTELRQGIIEDLLQGRAQPVTTALVSFVVGLGRGRDLPAIVDRMVERAAEERSEAIGEVVSAVPLNEQQIDRLSQALSARTGKNVSVKVSVDPSILGGIVATIGDTVIDGSVRRRLEQLRETL